MVRSKDYEVHVRAEVSFTPLSSSIQQASCRDWAKPSCHTMMFTNCLMQHVPLLTVPADVITEWLDQHGLADLPDRI